MDISNQLSSSSGFSQIQKWRGRCFPISHGANPNSSQMERRNWVIFSSFKQLLITTTYLRFVIHYVIYLIFFKAPLKLRNRPKFGFGCSVAAETDLKCSFGSVSVTVPTPHFTFGFGSNYTAEDWNWPKLQWVSLWKTYNIEWDYIHCYNA